MEFHPSTRNDPCVPTYSRFAGAPALIAMGDAIKRVRSANGIAQEDLALRCDMDRSYLGGIERGESNVTLLNLVKIADALGMRGSELLEHAGL